MPLRSRASVCLTALGLLLAACGGDSDAPITAGAAASTAASTDPATTTGTTTPSTTAPAAPVPTSNDTTPTTIAPEPPEAGVSTTPADSTAEVAPDCRRLVGFDDDTDGWVIVNDGVMGGRSDGRVEFADSEMRFTGDVVTQGGGFTSVRQALGQNELSGTDRIVMRVRADGRTHGLTHGLTMEDASRSGRRAISHRADLPIDASTDTDEWSTVTLAYAGLEPNVFGQPVDADPFDADSASEIGIIIADGRDGEFALAVDWIDACG